MATLRGIRTQIKSVKSTQQITKAMKMVATAKLRRAQEAIIAARPYARKLSAVLSHLAREIDQSLHPLLEQREIKKVALVVVTADRGLCGAFNSNIYRVTQQTIQEKYGDLYRSGNLTLITVGKKGSDFFGKRDYPIYAKYPNFFQKIDFAQSKRLTDLLTEGYMKRDFDQVIVIYNEFKNLIQQKLVVEQLFPIPIEDISSLPHSKQIAHTEYIYEPDVKKLITLLIPLHMSYQVWRVILESNASEQGARMAAMDNATLNAADMIRSLTLSYNKARQASITKELLEIVAGANALRGE